MRVQIEMSEDELNEFIATYEERILKLKKELDSVKYKEYDNSELNGWYYGGCRIDAGAIATLYYENINQIKNYKSIILQFKSEI